MRSVEDMLLQLILQGDSFTYHFVASHHHAAPIITMLDLMNMLYTSHCCIVVPSVITVLSYNMSHVLAAPCLPLLSMLAMLHHSCHVVHAYHVAPRLPCCPCFTMLAMSQLSHASIQHSIPSCPMHLYNTMYLAVPYIYTTLCTLMSYLLCCTS